MHLSLGRFHALAVALALLGAGCSSQGQPVKVEGVVTLDDKPLEGAIVTFLPETSESNIICVRLSCRCFWHPIIDENKMISSVVFRAFIFVTIQNCRVEVIYGTSL